MAAKRDNIEIIHHILKDEQSDHDKHVSAQFIKILENASSWEVPENKNREDIFMVLQERISQEGDRRKNRRSEIWHYAAASVVLICVGIYFLLGQFSTTTFEADLAQLKEYKLPDNSIVILNAGSKVSYDRASWQEGKRNVNLRGEAYFEVEKGSRFRVFGRHGIVTVLGTSFTIYDREDGFEVECYSGKVEVSSQSDHRSVYLTKGLKTHLEITNSKRLAEPQEFEQERGKEWLSGTFNFYNQPVSKVFRELERQFGVTVITQDTHEKYYTGTFDKDNLDHALSNICKPMGYGYEVLDNGQILIIN